MNPSANVQSLDGLAMFQMSLQHFQEKAKDALMNIDMDLRRTTEWLDEQYGEWKAEIRKAEDALQVAKLELNRKKMMKIGGRSPDTSDEEKRVKKCMARLEYAEEKLERTKHWQRTLPQEILNYEGPGRQLKTQVESVIPTMTALLNEKISVLEQYQKLG